MNPRLLAFWNEYKSCTGTGHDDFKVAEFGDSPELADHLADLIPTVIKNDRWY